MSSTYKAITSALAGLAICNNDSLFDLSELFKELPQTLVGRVVRQTPDENFRKRGVLLLHPGGGAGHG